MFLMFISLPGFKRGADPGMPEPSVLRWALWAGHVKIRVLTQKAAEDDRFCLSVCSGDEDGNYRPVHERMKTRPSSHHGTDLNSVLGCKYLTVTSSQCFCVTLLQNIALRNTKCFLRFFYWISHCKQSSFLIQFQINASALIFSIVQMRNLNLQ